VPQAPFAQTALSLKSSQENTGQDIQIFPSSILATDAGKSPTMAHFMVFTSIVKPLSTGRLTLRSADPSDAPLIDPGYFADPADMPRMIDAVRKARQISRSLSLSRLSAGELYPGPGATDSDSDLQAAIIAKGETYRHAGGTCRMGFAGDSRAVVDSKGKVHGTDRLYVVDASAFPIIPAANTHLPVIMAAERCTAWLAGTV
jgi:choline dehydrogenase